MIVWVCVYFEDVDRILCIFLIICDLMLCIECCVGGMI